ncbi:MAG: hypothetical protein OEZ35_02585 [Candidatus Bathyarchaeota archaeon]|nr:hypothetical protein [Candidatus Bathyarchaeota archaeon]
MTIIIDDAGIGDLLFGVVIGAFRHETQEFSYDILDVEYFTPKRFCQKEYLKQASRIVFQLLRKLKLKEEELIHVCKGYVFDEAAKDLKRTYGDNRVRRIKVTGEPQRLTETAYLDEIRNLGYKPLRRRAEKRAKSFFHMMSWLKKNPDKLRYAKTGWPRLSRYRLFRPYNRVQLRKNTE